MQTPILSLPWQEVPSEAPPLARLEALKDAMLKQSAQDGQRIHYHSDGSWLPLVSEIMAKHPTALQTTIYRDEYFDDRDPSLGFSGKWLRRRSVRGRETLTLKTRMPSQLGLLHQEIHGESAIAVTLATPDVNQSRVKKVLLYPLPPLKTKYIPMRDTPTSSIYTTSLEPG